LLLLNIAILKSWLWF